jgi:hypothetical protein
LYKSCGDPDDDARAMLAAKGMDGKRLTYRRINAA